MCRQSDLTKEKIPNTGDRWSDLLRKRPSTELNCLVERSRDKHTESGLCANRTVPKKEAAGSEKMERLFSFFQISNFLQLASHWSRASASRMPTVVPEAL